MTIRPEVYGPSPMAVDVYIPNLGQSNLYENKGAITSLFMAANH